MLREVQHFGRLLGLLPAAVMICKSSELRRAMSGREVAG
jgi:hypothetical protein